MEVISYSQYSLSPHAAGQCVALRAVEISTGSEDVR